MGQLVFQATLGGTTALVGPNTAATNSLTIPDASGALAWSTSALTSGRVTFAGTGGLLQDSANLFWDITNSNLGIGTSSPANKLHISNTAQQRFAVSSTLNHLEFWKDSTPTYAAAIGIDNPGAGGLLSAITFNQYTGSWAENMRIDSTGNLLVGTTTTLIAGTTLAGKAIGFSADYSASYAQAINSSSTTGTQNFVAFGRGGTSCGYISFQLQLTVHLLVHHQITG